MALFKPVYGDSSRISTDVTPFHEGYVYFTTDDGGFYADLVDADGNQVRRQINPKTDVLDATLAANQWSAKQNALSIDGLKQETNGLISLAPNATEEQVEAAANADMYIASQVDGFLIIVARGTTPSIDIPVSIIVLP